MAVPKSRTGKARKGKRRANWHLKTRDVNKCPHCGAPAVAASRLPRLWVLR